MNDSPSGRKHEILTAALSEFCENGYSGARLQAVADNIGVTKAMIHYYYNSKEGLFRAVFSEACNRVTGGLMSVLESEQELFPKIEQFISEAMDRFSKHPVLVEFVVTELNRNPEATTDLLKESIRYDSEPLEKQLREGASNYEIASVGSGQLLVNMLSLCMFPYSGRAFIKEIIDASGEDAMEDVMQSRKGIVTDTIFNWLTS